MTRLPLILAMLIGATFVFAQQSPTRSASSSTRSMGSPPAARDPSPMPSFGYVDLHIDPHNHPLAAWQVEFIAKDNSATLVGIEGGDTPAYKDPPHYDPAALTHSRIILAAYSTPDDLPTTKTRVARLHLQFTKPSPKYEVKLITAAVADGSKIQGLPSLSEGAQP
jgi:hypothetical protein